VQRIRRPDDAQVRIEVVVLAQSKSDSARIRMKMMYKPRSAGRAR
jgi:hypothetical protein